MTSRVPRPSGRIWVLPNRNTAGLVAVVAAMWYAGASQSNGAAYLLCFVISAVALVSTLHAWTNLRGIILSADPIRPVFAGEELVIPLELRSANGRSHRGIRVCATSGGETVTIAEVPAEGAASPRFQIKAARRGFFETLRLRIESRYPLGFFTAHRIVILEQRHFIYPQPIGSRTAPRASEPVRHAQSGQRAEGDDFGGVRGWRIGESQRHIDWKAAARGQPLLVKQWTGDADETALFDWDTLADLDLESRLSQLARWIVLAEARGSAYALRLPSASLPATRGEAHYHACLRLLAQFPPPVARPADAS